MSSDQRSSSNKSFDYRAMQSSSAGIRRPKKLKKGRVLHAAWLELVEDSEKLWSSVSTQASRAWHDYHNGSTRSSLEEEARQVNWERDCDIGVGEDNGVADEGLLRGWSHPADDENKNYRPDERKPPKEDNIDETPPETKPASE